MNGLFFVGGTKGGVGKSLVSMILLDILQEANPVLVETDTSNPDVGLAYKNTVETLTADLDTDAGWAKAFNEIHPRLNRPIVINSAARNSLGIARFGEMFAALDTPMTLFWCINQQKDGLLLLGDFLDVVQPARCLVVKNGYFGAETDFATFDESKVKKRTNGNIYLPSLLPAATNSVYSQRKPLHELPDILPFGDKLFFEAWRKKVWKIFEPLIKDGSK
jgi:hypothetical protein